MAWGVSDLALLDFRGECDIDTTEPREALELRVLVPSEVSPLFITADPTGVGEGSAIEELQIAGANEEELNLETGPVRARKNVDCRGG